MNIFNITYYTLKRLITDKQTMLFKVITPIITMVILGLALSSTFQVKQIEMVKIGVVKTEDNELINKLISNIFHSNENNSLLELTEISTFDDGKDMLNNKSIDALINFTPSFNDNKDNNYSLNVLCDEYSGYKATVIESATDSFSDILSIVNMNKNKDIGEIINNYYSSSITVDKTISIEDRVPTAMDYYAVTMLTLTLISGICFAASLFGSNYVGILGKRIKTTPVKNYQDYIGTLLGVIIANFIQGVIMILTTKYIFQVNWGTNMLKILFIAFTASVVASSLGALISTITKDVEKSESIYNIILPIMTLISGGYVKIDLGFLKYFSLNHYVQNAMFNVIYMGKDYIVNNNILICWVLTVLFALISIFIARRKNIDSLM